MQKSSIYFTIAEVVDTKFVKTGVVLRRHRTEMTIQWRCFVPFNHAVRRTIKL